MADIAKLNSLELSLLSGISSTIGDDVHAVSTILWPHGSPLVTYTGTHYPAADSWINSEVEQAWGSWMYANAQLNNAYVYSFDAYGPSYLFMQFNPIPMDSLVDTTLTLYVEVWDFYSGYNDPGQIAFTICDRFRNPITSTKYETPDRYTTTKEYSTRTLEWTGINLKKADLTALNLKIELVDYDDPEEISHELRHIWLEINGSGYALSEPSGEWVDYTGTEFWRGGQLNQDAPPWPTIDEENFPEIPPWNEVAYNSTWSGSWWHISMLPSYKYSRGGGQYTFRPFFNRNFQWSAVAGVGVGTSIPTNEGYDPFIFKRPSKMRLTISEGAISCLRIDGANYYRLSGGYGHLIGPSETYAYNSINWGPGVYEVDLNYHQDVIYRIEIRPTVTAGYAKITKIEFYMLDEGEHLPITWVSETGGITELWTTNGVEENPPYPHPTDWWGDYNGELSVVGDPDNWGWKKADKNTVGYTYARGDTDSIFPTILSPANNKIDIEWHLSVGNPITGVNPYIYITPVTYIRDPDTFIYSYHSLGDEEVCWQPSGDPGAYHSFVWEDINTTQSGYGLNGAIYTRKYTSDPYVEYYSWIPWDPNALKLRVVGGGEYDNYLWELRMASIKSTQPRWRNRTSESYWQTNDYITYIDTKWHVSSGDTGRLSVNGIWYKGVLFRKIRLNIESGGLSFVKIYDTYNRLLNEQWQPHAPGTYELDFTNATIDLGYIDFIADYDTVISCIQLQYPDNQHVSISWWGDSANWTKHGEYTTAYEAIADADDANYISTAGYTDQLILSMSDAKIYTGGVSGVDYDITLHIRAAASGTNTLKVSLDALGAPLCDEQDIEITGVIPTDYTVTWSQKRLHSGEFGLYMRVIDDLSTFVRIYNAYLSVINTWEDFGVYDLSVDVEMPDGISVASGSVTPSSGVVYSYDDGYAITATASGGCSFVEWVGDTDNLVDPYDSTTNLISPLHADTSVSARFDCPGWVYKSRTIECDADCYLRQYKPTSAYVFYNTTDTMAIGESSLFRYWNMMHFPDIDLPEDAIIVDAYLQVKPGGSYSTTIKVGMNMENAYSPSIPTDTSDFLARTMVSGSYDYGKSNEASWTTSTYYNITSEYTTPSGVVVDPLADILQQLITTHTGCGDVNVYCTYTPSGTSNSRWWYSHYYSGGINTAKLVINYYSHYND